MALSDEEVSLAVQSACSVCWNIITVLPVLYVIYQKFIKVLYRRSQEVLRIISNSPQTEGPVSNVSMRSYRLKGAGWLLQMFHRDAKHYRLCAFGMEYGQNIKGFEKAKPVSGILFVEGRNFFPVYSNTNMKTSK